MNVQPVEMRKCQKQASTLWAGGRMTRDKKKQNKGYYEKEFTQSVERPRSGTTMVTGNSPALTAKNRNFCTVVDKLIRCR